MLALCLPTLAASANAAEDPISANRPGFAESTDVVDAGVVQLETGGSLEHDSPSRGYEETFTTPTQLRVGLMDRLELQLTSDGYTRDKRHVPGAHETEHGYADASLGVKWGVQEGDENGKTPAIAALLQVDFDSGSAAFRGDGIRPSLRVPLEWSITRATSFDLMPAITYDKNERHRFFNGAFSVSTSTEWSDAWHTFAEIAAEQLAHSDDGGCVVSVGGGVMFLARNDIQLDLEVSRRANHNTPDWTFGSGLAYRF